MSLSLSLAANFSHARVNSNELELKQQADGKMTEGSRTRLGVEWKKSVTPSSDIFSALLVIQNTKLA